MDKIVPGRARRVLALGVPGSNAVRMLENALAADGMLIVMERDPDLADGARRGFQASTLGARTAVIVGDPRRMLHKLAGPFDVILFGSADPVLREQVTALLAPDGVMIDGTASDGR